MKTKSSSIPLQTALIYLIIAGSWIFFSDRFLALFSTDVTTINILQTYKGFFFVILTSTLLFFTLRTKLRMVERERIQRTRTENTFYENEAEYSLMIEHSGEAILLTDQNGTIFSANPAACKMFGRSSEEICRIGRVGIVDANDPRLQQALDERKRTGIIKGELNFIRSDGTIFPGEISSNIFKDVHGNERTSIIIRDISERQRKEESLRKSEMRLRRAENIARFGNWELSLTDKIMHASDGAKSIYGFEQNEMSLAEAQKAPLPEYRSYLDNALKVLIEQNKPYDVVFKIRRANDGKIVYIHSKAEYDADNKIIFGVFHDITEQKSAEEALMLSESNLQTVINREESIWSLDKNYNLIICNDFFRNAYRAAYNIEINVGTNLVDILSPELKAFWKPKYDAALSGQRISFEFQAAIQGKNYYFENFLNPIASNGFVTGVTALSVNITERKNAEEELRTHAKQLGALLKSSQKLSTTLNRDTVFQTTTDSIIELTDLQSAAIYMREGEMLYLGATSPSLPAQFPEELRRAPLKDHPHIYEAITTAQPVFVFDTAVVELTPAERIISEQRGLRSILYLPVIVEEKAIGVLIVAHIGEPKMLTVSEIEMCKTLTNLSSIAVENSRLYEATQQEIADRKNAEQSLSESEEKFRVLFESAKDGIMQFTIEGDIVAVNESFAKMHGYTVDELMKKNFIELDTPETRRLAAARMEKFKAGESMTFEVEHYHKNGQIIPLEVSGNRVFIGDQQYILGFHRDITERKKTEEALRQSEARFRNLLQDVNSVAVQGYSPDGTTQYWNKASERLYGFTSQEAIGRNLLDLIIPSEIRSDVEKAMRQMAETGEPIPASELSLQRKDGTRVSVLSSHSIVQIPGRNQELFCIDIDLTERKQAEESLRQAQKMESIGTLAGGIAHDFNNLLNAVLGQSALAINKLPKESPAVSNITKAIQASERAADLTRQLLAYSGKGKFFTVEIDLNKLVNENVQMLEVSIPKTTQLRYELCSPSPHIIGDISQIQQVIMNLIINAGEAMGPNPGYITIRTSRIELQENNTKYTKYTTTPLAAGSYAMLQVSDTGSGISQETLERIFDPFFTTKFTGRGLGLAAVLGIIKGHKGGLHIESEERKGTMFEIVWPLAEQSTISKVQEKNDATVPEGEGKTILIIDDDPFVFQLLEDVLGEVKFTVIGTTDPLKGIELYRKEQQKISMIILDFSMPTMNGKDAFEMLLQINDNVKVLLCSGYPEEDTLSLFGKVRPTGFLQKPYKPEALVEWVSRNC